VGASGAKNLAKPWDTARGKEEMFKARLKFATGEKTNKVEEEAMLGRVRRGCFGLKGRATGVGTGTWSGVYKSDARQEIV